MNLADIVVGDIYRFEEANDTLDGIRLRVISKRDAYHIIAVPLTARGEETFAEWCFEEMHYGFEIAIADLEPLSPIEQLAQAAEESEVIPPIGEEGVRYELLRAALG